MARFKHKSHIRDGSKFVALPHIVLDCDKYQSLSFSACVLLIDIARQYTGNNNGKLVICDKALKPRGWGSSATIHKAKRDLIEAGFIWETRKGQVPNKASWFAITWYALDWSRDMDIVATTFPRGAYLHKKK